MIAKATVINPTTSYQLKCCVIPHARWFLVFVGDILTAFLTVHGVFSNSDLRQSLN